MDSAPSETAGREPEHTHEIASTKHLDEDPMIVSDRLPLDSAVELMRSAYASQPGNIDFTLKFSSCLLARARESRSAADNDEIIFLLRRALHIAPDLNESPFLLESLGVALQSRFERVGKDEDLQAAITTHRRVVELMPDEYSGKARLLGNLAIALHRRFEHAGELDDLEAAISNNRRAVELTPDRNPDKPFLLSNLGNALQDRFKHLSELADLEAAISLRRHALLLTPDQHPGKVASLNYLGVALLDRFQCVGNPEDLHAALAANRRAVALTPDGYPGKPSQLNNFGLALYCRFQYAGELPDLETAISTYRRAIELTPDGHPRKPTVLNNLGTALQSRFERLEELEDLEEATSTKRRAVGLTSDGHPDKPRWLGNLGSALQVRFVRHGRLEDLEAAISMTRHAVVLTPDGHSDKPKWLSNLGAALQNRYERIGELEDIEEAIFMKRRTVELAPDESPYKPTWLHNLAKSLQSRFSRHQELEDIDAAISTQCRAVALMPEGHPDKPRLWDCLGIALQARYQRVGNLKDLTQAISSGRSAVELTPDGHPLKPTSLNNLGVALQSRFERAGELHDLEQAVLAIRCAVQITPDGHPEKPEWLNNLGTALRKLFEQRPAFTAFNEASACFVNAIACPSGSSFTQFRSATRLVRLVTEHPNFASTALLLDAHSHLMRILPELIWVGHSLDRRYEESSWLAHHVYDAVSTAIRHGALPRAVEWLETGRSLVWSQLLALRTPMDELEMHRPDLAKDLYQVQRQLQHTAHFLRSDHPHAVVDGQGSCDTVLDHHRAFSIKRDGLLRQIRKCEGFENFLLSKPFSTLLQSRKLCHGHFVYINANNFPCNALVVAPCHDEPMLVDLPELSLDRAEELQSLWIEQLHQLGRCTRSSDSPTAPSSCAQTTSTSDTDDLQRHSAFVQEKHLTCDHLLECLWDWVVRPVLEALNLLCNAEAQPHITWCPTGPLTRIPLHAAGRYSERNGPRAYDYVVSSYAPSLSALTRAAEGLAKKAASSSVLIVTQSETPGHAPLRGTMEESRRLCQLLNGSKMPHDVLNHKQATREAVLSVMDRHSWVHFACHGSQRKSDPTKSAFHLYDGPLSLADLMQTVSDDAELAFLSACQTATGDEKNPEEAVHLAAGMLAVGYKGVVATMWSIGDADAPVVVEAYYKKLLELRSARTLGKGETGAAYALHEAVQVLRKRVGETNFLRWAPFVHYGV
ncbi:unnamed protein product [Peniophora sp. CBMAI 1063]|nr:unnamed protein product [Peniophora sp. CBMAI 1063]